MISRFWIFQKRKILFLFLTENKFGIIETISMTGDIFPSYRERCLKYIENICDEEFDNNSFYDTISEFSEEDVIMLAHMIHIVDLIYADFNYHNGNIIEMAVSDISGLEEWVFDEFLPMNTPFCEHRMRYPRENYVFGSCMHTNGFDCIRGVHDNILRYEKEFEHNGNFPLRSERTLCRDNLRPLLRQNDDFTIDTEEIDSLYEDITF